MGRPTRLRLVGRYQVVAVKTRTGPPARKQPKVFDFATQRLLILHAADTEEAGRIAEGLTISGYEVMVYDLRTDRHIK